MAVAISRAIWFQCEHCGHGQYDDDTLVPSWESDRMVMADHVDCEKCGKENRVIEEVSKSW